MIDDDLIIDAFVQIFRGRGDVYGSSKGYCVHEPLTRDVFEKHLRSTDPRDHVGVYCMMGDKASWGCIDIDGKDWPVPCPECSTLDTDDANLCRNCVAGQVWDWQQMWTLACNLATVLAAKNIHATIERTKNGYHVWVFPKDGIVTARAMRRALMAACVAISYNPKEVNPKAEGPRPGTQGLGNFVRVPYGGYLTTREIPTQRVMVDGFQAGRWLQEFLAHIKLTETADLESVAALWTPPPPPSTEIDYDAGLEVEPILPMLDGLAFTMWRDGPLPGKDRSTTLAHLGRLTAERGLTATQTFAVLQSADVRWGGKFANRADGLEQIARLVENAYN